MKSFKQFLAEEKEKDKEPEKDRIGKKTHSEEEIAKKHKVSVDYVEKQIDKGKKIEMEHTDNEEEAEEIARDHLWEFIHYYSELPKMEKKLEKKQDK